MSRFKGFTRIATSFEPTEIRMAVAALEGAGYITIAPGLQITDTLPMNSLAFGPLEVYVPDDDAETARALLEAIASGTVIPHDQRDLVDDPDDPGPPPRQQSWLGNVFGYVLAGVSRPLKGLSVDRKRPKD